jgi:hypothetical protein
VDGHRDSWRLNESLLFLADCTSTKQDFVESRRGDFGPPDIAWNLPLAILAWPSTTFVSRLDTSINLETLRNLAEINRRPMEKIHANWTIQL